GHGQWQTASEVGRRDQVGGCDARGAQNKPQRAPYRPREAILHVRLPWFWCTSFTRRPPRTTPLPGYSPFRGRPQGAPRAGRGRYTWRLRSFWAFHGNSVRRQYRSRRAVPRTSSGPLVRAHVPRRLPWRMGARRVSPPQGPPACQRRPLRRPHVLLHDGRGAWRPRRLHAVLYGHLLDLDRPPRHLPHLGRWHVLPWRPARRGGGRHLVVTA